MSERNRFGGVFFGILKWFFIACGVVSLAGAAAIAAFVFYKIGPGNRASSETVPGKDLRYVLNSCGLSGFEIEQTVHSFRSARSFTGDHLDAHAMRIRIKDGSENSLEEILEAGWVRGDLASGVTADAVEFVCWSLDRDEIRSWFPREEELRSDGIYVFTHLASYLNFFHTDFYKASGGEGRIMPHYAKVVFFRPEDGMLFFISSKI